MSTEYVRVAQRGQHYMIVHVQKENQQLSHPTTEIKTAQYAAQRIAKILQIPYCREIYRLQKDCITMIQEEKEWVPARLDEDKISRIEDYEVGCKLFTLGLAKLIAETKQCNFVSPDMESVCVVKMGPIYMVTYIVGEEKILIGYELCEEKANSAAKTFARKHFLSYDDVVYQPDRPIITLVNRDGNWFVAELTQDGLAVKQEPIQNETHARNLAYLIAKEKGYDMIPELGNLLYKCLNSQTT